MEKVNYHEKMEQGKVGGDGSGDGEKVDTTLVDLLEEVKVMDSDSIFAFLRWNDLLRMRRVCKATNRTTTEYMRRHPELAPELEINEEDKSFGAFLKMGIPTNKLFLNNVSREEFYTKDRKNLKMFVKKYRTLVTSLRVLKFSLVLAGGEMDFPDEFPNLKAFEAGSFVASASQERFNLAKRNAQGRLSDPMNKKRKKDGIPYPGVFKYLESLKIGQDEEEIENILGRTDVAMGSLWKNLKHCAMPFSPYINKEIADQKELRENTPPVPENAMAYAFIWIACHVHRRKTETPGKPNLRSFDFTWYHKKLEGITPNLDLCSRAFLALCKYSTENGVKLMNVGASWFQDRDSYREFRIPELGAPVVSMVNLHPCILTLEMPNLERLEIKATSDSPVCPLSQIGDQRPEWPKLRSLDITVDSEVNIVQDRGEGLVMGRVLVAPMVHMLRSHNSLDFCFKEIRRLALTDLRLKYAVDGQGKLPIPKMELVINACPNMKKITLVNWLGKQSHLLKLWEGLPGLEEITLEKCKHVGNVTFVGVDTQNPVLFKLKNLKKLSLKGLDKMPKITDLLFSMVIRHLSLSHLIITSDEPIQSVTSDGIMSLLDNHFALSIEKFPFTGWSLAGVSSEAMKNMEVKFRSYHMI